MLLTILLFSLLFIIGSFSKAVMDTLKSTFKTSRLKIFKGNQWLDPALFHKNKYKNGDHTQGERFFGSTTVLVFITDAWHAAQMIFLSCFILLVVFLNFNDWILDHWYIGYIIVFSAFTGPFELFYRWLNFKNLLTGKPSKK